MDGNIFEQSYKYALKQCPIISSYKYVDNDLFLENRRDFLDLLIQYIFKVWVFLRECCWGFMFLWCVISIIKCLPTFLKMVVCLFSESSLSTELFSHKERTTLLQNFCNNLPVEKAQLFRRLNSTYWLLEDGSVR
jgi:hypothetical protein